MSQARVIKLVRPTKIEYIRLVKRLALAKRVHRILRDKFTMLIKDFQVYLRDAKKARYDANIKAAYVSEAIKLAVAMHGVEQLENIASQSRATLTVYLGTSNVMGVRVPSMEYKLDAPKEGSYPLVQTSSYVDDLYKKMLNYLKTLVELAENEKALNLIASDLMRTKRKVNALEHVLIPRLAATIRYLRLRFDELERENIVRLKRVKSILARRGGLGGIGR